MLRCNMVPYLILALMSFAGVIHMQELFHDSGDGCPVVLTAEEEARGR